MSQEEESVVDAPESKNETVESPETISDANVENTSENGVQKEPAEDGPSSEEITDKNENEESTEIENAVESEELEPKTKEEDEKMESDDPPKEKEEEEETNKENALVTVENTLQEANLQFNISGLEDEQNDFGSLTPDLVIRIFSYLDIADLLNIQLVSQEWLVYGRCDNLWKELYEAADWKYAFTTVAFSSWYEFFKKRYLNEIGALDDGEPDLVDLLQDTENVTIEKLRRLLEMEEFVMALQNGEDAVLTYLEAPSTIIAMMNLLFKEPFVTDDLQNQRIIHITVQTLVSGIITDVFIMNTDLLHILFDHLDELDLISPGAQAKSSCMSKIISILFEKFTMQMIGHFQSRESFIPSLLLNIQDNNLMEMLYKFVDSDLTHQWLFESDLTTRLVALLHQDETIEIQEQSANVLVSVLSLCQSWPQSALVNDMLNNEVITGSIIGYMESKPLNGEAVKLGLRVLIGILSLISDELEDPPAVVTLLANSIGFFTKILLDPENMDNAEPFNTTTGPIQRGFGFVRLGVLELLVSLLYTGFPNVVEFMLEERVFPVILDLMFQFPWNNIIHNQISQLFSGLFCCNNPEVIITVMEDCGLPERIADAHNNAAEKPVGFLGHLRELANELVRAGKMSDIIAEYLETKPAWLAFLEDDLKEFNLIECVVQDDYLDYDNQYFQEDQFEEYEVIEEADLSGGFEEYDEAEPIQEY